MIQIRNASFAYQTREILKNIAVQVEERRLGIIGSNGSGKSTFARMLNGLILPHPGEVRINGLCTRAATKEVRRQVGFVFQNPDNQIVMPLVHEDIAFGLKNYGFAHEEIADRTSAILKQFGLWEYRDFPAHHLSGGQKQLLAIAGVVVLEPKLIVFDEPTTLLDLRNRNVIKQLIAQLIPSVVVVSHDLEWMQDFERIIVIEEGQIIADDIPAKAIAAYRRHVEQ